MKIVGYKLELSNKFFKGQCEYCGCIFILNGSEMHSLHPYNSILCPNCNSVIYFNQLNEISKEQYKIEKKNASLLNKLKFWHKSTQ